MATPQNSLRVYKINLGVSFYKYQHVNIISDLECKCLMLYWRSILRTQKSQMNNSKSALTTCLHANLSKCKTSICYGPPINVAGDNSNGTVLEIVQYIS